MSELNVDTVTCDKVVAKEVVVQHGENKIHLFAGQNGCGIHLTHKDNLISIYSYDSQGPAIGLTKDGLKSPNGYQLALYIDKNGESIQVHREGTNRHIKIEDIKTE